ncbi:MAG TPA: kelch repeat-containing protein [Blastocatellia bacterium]|nr:kelch repeat-containing protein [Blastocatellia bacterium]
MRHFVINQRHYSSFNITLLICMLAGFMQVKAQHPAWKATGALGEARTRHTATLLANGKVLVVGGLSAPRSCCGTAGSAELYDPATGRWSVTGSPITPRHSHVAVRLANGKVLIAGGSGQRELWLANAEIYDPDTRTWNAAGNLRAGRLFHRAILLNNGKALVAGGVGGGNTAEVYDPTTNAWSSAGAMNAERSNHSLTLLSDGRALAAGGGVTANASRTAEIYDPATKSDQLSNPARHDDRPGDGHCQQRSSGHS